MKKSTNLISKILSGIIVIIVATAILAIIILADIDILAKMIVFLVAVSGVLFFSGIFNDKEESKNPDIINDYYAGESTDSSCVAKSGFMADGYLHFGEPNGLGGYKSNGMHYFPDGKGGYSSNPYPYK